MGMSFAHKNNTERFNWLIDQAIEAENRKQEPRTYLGGSRLGHSCARALQYEYTHTKKDDGREFSGRILRIFERGHVFEDMMARWLRLAGFKLLTHKPDGEQFGFMVAKGRIAGHLDGVLVGGPEIYKYPCLWECKALGAKGWKKVVKEKLAKAYPVYHGQMGIYQAYMKLTDNPGLFTAINADTMEIYPEEVPFDGGLAQRLSDRGVQVLECCDRRELLPRIASEPDFFECRFCDYHDTCWNM